MQLSKQIKVNKIINYKTDRYLLAFYLQVLVNFAIVFDAPSTRLSLPAKLLYLPRSFQSCPLAHSFHTRADFQFDDSALCTEYAGCLEIAIL